MGSTGTRAFCEKGEVKRPALHTDVTLTSRQRQVVQQAALRWVESDDFFAHFYVMHPPRFAVALSCLGLGLTIIKASRIPAVLSQARRNGMGTAELRQGYIELVKTGIVAMAGIWRAKPGLSEGKLPCGFARVMASAEGTPEGEAFAFRVWRKVLTSLKSTSNDPQTAAARALSEDKSFEMFRAQKLPESLAGKHALYIFDTVVHKSATPDPTFQQTSAVVCLVNPQMQPPILVIPHVLATQDAGWPGARIAVS